VTLFQIFSKTGGGTHSFRWQNMEFDTGLHYTSRAMSQTTTRPGILMDFMTKGRQKFHPFAEPYDEIVFPDRTSYPYMNGKERTIDALFDKLEKDYGNHELVDDGYGEYHPDILRPRVKVFMDLYSEIHKGFVALGLSRILPKWLHFLVKARVQELKKLSQLTVRDVQYDVLNLGYTKEQLLRRETPHAHPHERDHIAARQRLKAILAHPIGDYGTQPRDASLAAHGVTAEHYIDGGSYTVGATQNISINMTSVIHAYGGDVFCDATVRDIIIDEHGKAVGVRVSKTSNMEIVGDLAPSLEIRAKNIVCGTSNYNLYNKLLPQQLPVVKDYHDPSKRTMRQSNGHLFVFCKLKGDPDELKLPDHNLWYFNGDDLDAAYDAYYRNPELHRPPVVYIGFPCTKDQTWKKRFPGTSNCIVISDCLYEWFEKWADKPVHKRGPEYDALKEQLAVSLLGILYEYVPQLKGKVEGFHFATPLTEESYLGSFRGGAYDTLCTPAMFASINEKWITNPKTQIPGLYLAGSSAFFPGLTGSMYGGCLCAFSLLSFFDKIRLAHLLFSHLATRLQEENPKLPWPVAYRMAISKFVNE